MIKLSKENIRNSNSLKQFHSHNNIWEYVELLPMQKASGNLTNYLGLRLDGTILQHLELDQIFINDD